MSSLLFLTAGFLFGLKHALEADHLLTVTALINRTRFFHVAAWLATLWGLGHTVILLAVGIVVLAFKLAIPEMLAVTFELIVGVVLAMLGLQVLLKLGKDKFHLHAHEHGQIKHTHFHSHGESETHIHNHKPLLLGMLHGLAGSAGLTILVLASVNSFTLGILYILIFGAGSVIGMIAVSSLVSLPFLFMKKESGVGEFLSAIVGLSGLILGLEIIITHSDILQKMRMFL